MFWLTWRLQRIEIWLLLLLSIGVAALLVATRDDLVADSRRFTPGECPGVTQGTEGGCFIQTSALYELVNESFVWFNLLPLIVALLTALPVVADLDRGTRRFVWTQGVTRGRWTIATFGIALGAGVAFAALTSLAFEWWNSPADVWESRLNEERFDFRGVTTIGYTIFAIGLTLVAGTVTRRPAAALAGAGAIFVAVRLLFRTWFRERLVEPVTAPIAGNEPVLRSLRWPSETFWVDRRGVRLSDAEFTAFCRPSSLAGRAFEDCIAREGLTAMIRFRPDSQFWSLQLIETAIYAAAGLSLIGFAAWWVLRRVE